MGLREEDFGVGVIGDLGCVLRALVSRYQQRTYGLGGAYAECLSKGTLRQSTTFLSTLSHRVDRLDERMNRIEDRMHTGHDLLIGKIGELDARLARLEERLAR